MPAGWKHTDETRAKIRESQQARGAKARSDAAKQAKKTMGAEARSAAAKKGHETRRAKAAAGSGVPGTFAEGSFMSAPGVGEASLGSQSFAAVASVSPSVFRLPSISQVPALREGLQAVIPEHLKPHRSADSSQARGPRR
ncbi:hypothetical protein RKD42_000292 [Streptomyces ambofaciens]